METDARDFFVRGTRFLTDDLQVGATYNLQERNVNATPRERKHETGAEVTWWISDDLQLAFNYRYQRIENPGQITSINPFVETFAGGVTSNNHVFWTTLSYEF